MSARLGLALEGREIRAVLFERAAVTWKSSAEVRGVDSLAAAVESLLANAPPRVRRARVGVCVGPSHVQVKQLHGLPQVKSAQIATQLLRENHQAFFLARGATAIADVHVPSAGGAAWGAAFDREIVDELTRVLRAAGLRVERIAPTLVALGAASPGKTVRWGAYTIEGDASGPRRIERSLEEVEADADPYLDAYAAARAARTSPLAWRPPPDPSRTRMLSFARNVASGTALCVAIGFAAFGPGLRARAAHRAGEVELARFRPAQRELAQGEADIRRITQTLDRVATFSADRGQMTRLMGELSQTIPESTAMVTFHVDSVEGGFTALAPHIADVLPELGSMTSIESARIVGSVTRETVGAAHVERATFRFRRPRAKGTAK